MANPLWDAWRRRTPNYGNIYVPPLPPPGQRTPEQVVSGGLPTHRLNQLNRWRDIGLSPNLTKWGSMPSASSPQYDHTMGAGAGSAAKKKGLSVKNMINAMSKMKAPTGMDFGRAGGRVGGSRPTAPSPRALGVDALEMASADDPRKKWWKQWQGLMGA
jgi:hypothetical protein